MCTQTITQHTLNYWTQQRVFIHYLLYQHLRLLGLSRKGNIIYIHDKSKIPVPFITHLFNMSPPHHHRPKHTHTNISVNYIIYFCIRCILFVTVSYIICRLDHDRGTDQHRAAAVRQFCSVRYVFPTRIVIVS